MATPDEPKNVLTGKHALWPIKYKNTLFFQRQTGICVYTVKPVMDKIHGCNYIIIMYTMVI